MKFALKMQMIVSTQTMERQTEGATHVTTTILLFLDRKETGSKIVDYLMMMTFLPMKCVVDVKVCKILKKYGFKNIYTKPT